LYDSLKFIKDDLFKTTEYLCDNNLINIGNYLSYICTPYYGNLINIGHKKRMIKYLVSKTGKSIINRCMVYLYEKYNIITYKCIQSDTQVYFNNINKILEWKITNLKPSERIKLKTNIKKFMDDNKDDEVFQLVYKSLEGRTEASFNKLYNYIISSKIGITTTYIYNYYLDKLGILNNTDTIIDIILKKQLDINNFNIYKEVLSFCDINRCRYHINLLLIKIYSKEYDRNDIKKYLLRIDYLNITDVDILQQIHNDKKITDDELIQILLIYNFNNDITINARIYNFIEKYGLSDNNMKYIYLTNNTFLIERTINLKYIPSENVINLINNNIGKKLLHNLFLIQNDNIKRYNFNDIETNKSKNICSLISSSKYKLHTHKNINLLSINKFSDLEKYGIDITIYNIRNIIIYNYNIIICLLVIFPEKYDYLHEYIENIRNTGIPQKFLTWYDLYYKNNNDKTKNTIELCDLITDKIGDEYKRNYIEYKYGPVRIHIDDINKKDSTNNSSDVYIKDILNYNW
jgi:hypothetical protein